MSANRGRVGGMGVGPRGDGTRTKAGHFRSAWATGGRRRGRPCRPGLEGLEQRLVLSSIAIGAAPGGQPTVQVLDENGQVVRSFQAFDGGYTGGVSVALGDVTQDGVEDVIVGTRRGLSIVKVFDGATYQEIRSFQAFPTSYRGGVEVAFGFFDRPSGAIVVGTAQRQSQVKVFDGASSALISQFTAYGRGTNGVHVTVADIDQNPDAEVVTTPGRGGAPVLKGFDPTSGTPLYSIAAERPSYRGGLQVTAGDFDGNLVLDVATAAQGRVRGGGRVRVWTRGTGDPVAVGEFQVASRSRSGGLILGTVDEPDGTPDRIAVAQSGAGSSGQPIPLFGRDGAPLGTLPPTGLGSGRIDASSAPESFAPSVVPSSQWVHGFDYSPKWPGWKLQGNSQFEDSDFYNSAFKDLWSTPRYQDSNNKMLSDIEAIKASGAKVIRLYDWNPQRGYNASTGQATEHIAFLDALQAAGIKVIVPVSNFFLSDDAFAWAEHQDNRNDKPITRRYDPDSNYSIGSASPDMQKALDFFIASVTKNGKLHPAVAGFEVGNEIDLNPGKASGDAGSLVKRSIWWAVNLQQKLQARGDLNPNDPNRVRFTFPVSNADEDSKWLAQKSWFQVFRNGAKAGDYVPGGSLPNGSTFKSDIKGLVALKGANWYNTWFYNSYQTFKSGPGLQDLIAKYNAPRGSGNWNNRWPGENFPVPLLITELGSSIVEAGSEDKYFQIQENQAKVAETFLRGKSKGTDNQVIKNEKFLGYLVFEFNQEPNKTESVKPDSEQTRGVFKYYSSTDVNKWRTPDKLVKTASTGTTQLVGRSFSSVQYPVYQHYPIKSASGVRLFDRIKDIFAGKGI